MSNQYPPPPSPGMGYPAPQNSSKATTALILGIIGLAVCSPVGIAAIVVGKQAREEIARSGGALGGEGFAKAGVILGWIAVAFMILGALFFILFFVLAAASSTT